MTAPNLAGVSVIKGKMQGSNNLGTTSTTIVTCATDRVLKLNSIIAANIDGADSAEVSVSIFDASDSAEYFLASQIPVQGKSTLVVLSKDNALYLEENDQLRAKSSSADIISLAVSYEEITDI